METVDGKSRLEQIRALLAEDPAATTTAILDFFKEQYGGTGFLMNTLAQEKPSTFVLYALDADRLLGPPNALDAKTRELISVAAATALMCDHCLKGHIESARSDGASWDEILDTILIAAHIAESSALSVALRSYKQTKSRLAHDGPETAGPAA